MKQHNITIELAGEVESWAGPKGDEILDTLADMHPAIGRSALGRGELIITIPAETIKQATTIGLALTAHLPITRITVESSEDFDARAGIEVPALLSITEAATQLGITRAGVQKRIDTGTLAAVRVGNAWAIPAAAI